MQHQRPNRSLLTVTLLFLSSCVGLAAPRSSLYQVDMIVFAHQPRTAPGVDNAPTPLLASNTHYAIPLQNSMNSSMTPYHTLPSSSSGLRNELWALNHKLQYQVLCHYTWLQPASNLQPIALPQTNHGDWNLEGTIQIRQSNYYLLDTALLFSDKSNHQPAFIFAQKQRLKPGVVYYLDHPKAGMLIKVHQIA